MQRNSQMVRLMSISSVRCGADRQRWQAITGLGRCIETSSLPGHQSDRPADGGQLYGFK